MIPQIAVSAENGDDESLEALAKIKDPEAEKVLSSVIEKNINNKTGVKAVAALASVNMKTAVDYSVKLFEQASNKIDYDSNPGGLEPGPHALAHNSAEVAYFFLRTPTLTAINFIAL